MLSGHSWCRMVLLWMVLPVLEVTIASGSPRVLALETSQENRGQPVVADFVLKGGTLVDGTGAPDDRPIWRCARIEWSPSGHSRSIDKPRSSTCRP